MGCRCNERGVAIVRGVRAAVKADLKTVTEQAAFVVKSSVEDARSAIRQSAASAKQRLMSRR